MLEGKLLEVLVRDGDLLLGTKEHLVVLGEPASHFEIVEDDVVVLSLGGTPDGFGVAPVDHCVEVDVRAQGSGPFGLSKAGRTGKEKRDRSIRNGFLQNS